MASDGAGSGSAPLSRVSGASLEERGLEGCWQEQEFSDVTLTISIKIGEEQPQLHTVPALCILLIMNSHTLEIWLRRWRTEKERADDCVDIPVETEEEGAAVLQMLKMMYNKRQLPADITPTSALEIAVAAERFQAIKIRDAVLEWLRGQEFNWEDAVRFYALAPALRESWCALAGKALAALQREAGDLEVALNDSDVRAKLLALPEAGIIALLSSDDTQVASEATAAAVAVQWSATAGKDTVPDAVAYCVRVAHVPDAYIAAVSAFFPQWTTAALALVRVCKAYARALAEAIAQKLEPLVCNTSFKQRALSPVTSAHGVQKVRLADIESTFNISKGMSLDCSNKVPAQTSHQFFGGWLFSLCCTFNRAGSTPGAAPLLVAVSAVAAAAPAKQQPRHTFIKRRCTASCADTLGRAIKERTATFDVTSNRRCGWADFFDVSALSAWDASKFAPWVDAAGDITFTFKASVV
jgi:hypothetical protein